MIKKKIHSMNQVSIVFLICWQGDYPWYFPYFIHSCRYNPTIDFLIFTNNADVELDLPANIRAFMTDELLKEFEAFEKGLHYSQIQTEVESNDACRQAVTGTVLL
jgi:hypothetical protein